MPINRGKNFRQFPINIVGSSIFGRYPKINIEKTYNMFESDKFMVPYAGYQVAILASEFSNGKEGRAVFTSTKFEKLVIVIDNKVYLATLTFSQKEEKVTYQSVALIGTLQTSTGPVYIAENNKPQIGISDGTAFYVYDPTLTPSFQVITTLNFVPGYLTFHDTYFILAASQDETTGLAPVNNTWRLSASNDGTQWPNTSQKIGYLQTKPDNTQAVVRFPSKGNMIFVMGSIVTEAWFDTGAQLFPYQRNNQFNIDYGCLQPATVAYMDEIVVWLAQNEKSGPIIVYSDGGMPKQISTDGIDFLFSTLQNPADSQAFLYRQDGHLFYHINFYTDNLSLVYDFITGKFYHASDQNLNYFIAAEIAFYNNQYYFVSKNTGNLYAFDTEYYTYQDTDSAGKIINYEIPRIRTCANIRTPDQEYQIINDIGFTIESGEIDYQIQSLREIILVTQDCRPLISQGEFVALVTQDENYLITQDGSFLNTQNHAQCYDLCNHFLITQDYQNLLTQDGSLLYTQQFEPCNADSVEFLVTQDCNLLLTQNDDFLITQPYSPCNTALFIAQQMANTGTSNLSLPHVDLSISIDGGATFGNEWAYYLPAIGNRKNRLMWWQIGIANDFVPQFKFWGMGRFVCTDGICNTRI